MNDLEAAAAQIHPEVLSLKTAARRARCAWRALMTGSGSAVFGVWRAARQAAAAAEELRVEDAFGPER